jgi:hypothetical protein
MIAAFTYGAIYLTLAIGIVCYYYNYKKLGLILIIPPASLLLYSHYENKRISEERKKNFGKLNLNTHPSNNYNLMEKYASAGAGLQAHRARLTA